MEASSTNTSPSSSLMHFTWSRSRAFLSLSLASLYNLLSPPLSLSSTYRRSNVAVLALVTAEPTSHFYFPREIISNILSRLPVKTLLRFRCVCKNLISKPSFIAAHFRHSSSLQLSGSSIRIGTRHQESNHHILSLYNLPESVVQLDSPFPCFFPNMYIVGPCNGIVCHFNPPWGELITLWNPAMRKYEMVELSESLPIQGLHFLASVGMAFDFQQNDLLILRIFCVGITSDVPNHVEMYSTKNRKWKKLKNDMVFHIVEFTCNVIVKGVAYWLVCMPDKFGSRAVFVRFDVGKLEFEKLPSIGWRKKHQYLVELEGSLCMFDWDHKDDCHMDVWVMDDVDGWSMKYSVGPLVGFDRILGCLRNGDIVAKNEKGVIFLYDPITSSVKEKFSIDNAKNGSYVIVDYSESLFLIGGMLPVKKQDAQDKLARKRLTRKNSMERNHTLQYHPKAFHVFGPRHISSPGWRELISSSWKDESYRRIVMACFVQSVYLLELDRQENRRGTETALAPQWWTPFKYKLVEPLVDERDGSIFAAVLEWDQAAALADFIPIRPTRAPKVVLAIRGTLLKNPTIRRDIEDDLRYLAWESLKGSFRFDRVLSALKSIILNQRGSKNVSITGHSLGAGFALEVYKALAAEGIYVEAHLFNPPSVSLAMSLRILSEKAGFVWKRFKSVLPSHSEYQNRSVPEGVAEATESRITSELKQMLPMPHLYVNTNDYICCYYNYPDGGQNCSFNVGNKEKEAKQTGVKLFVVSKVKQRFLEAHRLKQWWSDDLELQMALNNSMLISRQLNSLYTIQPPKQIQA